MRLLCPLFRLSGVCYRSGNATHSVSFRHGIWIRMCAMPSNMWVPDRCRVHFEYSYLTLSAYSSLCLTRFLTSNSSDIIETAARFGQYMRFHFTYYIFFTRSLKRTNTLHIFVTIRSWTQMTSSSPTFGSNFLKSDSIPFVPNAA